MKRLLAVLPLVAVMACASAAPTVQRSAAPPAIAPAGAGSAESVVVESRDLSAIDEAVRVGGCARTLLVLDIDDTLLTSETFFGSDSWYEWQKTLKPGDPGLVPCRFDVIALNYEAGTQRATEAGGPQYINGLTLPSLLLTSRNSLYRAATTRELDKAGYSRRPSLGGEEFLAYSWKKDSSSKPVLVGYADGIFMVTGQDKGLLLLDLLKRLALPYDRVVLVDDGQRNIDAMKAALAAAGVGFYGIHYGRVYKCSNDCDTVAGRDGWTAWKNLLQHLYPYRLQRMEAGECFFE